MAVLEEFKVTFYVNIDLNKFGMTVNSNNVRFGLLDFNFFFKNNSFFA